MKNIMLPGLLFESIFPNLPPTVLRNSPKHCLNTCSKSSFKPHHPHYQSVQPQHTSSRLVNEVKTSSTNNKKKRSKNFCAYGARRVAGGKHRIYENVLTMELLQGFQDRFFFMYLKSFRKFVNCAFIRPEFWYIFLLSHFVRHRRFFGINLATFTLTRRSEASRKPGFFELQGFQSTFFNRRKKNCHFEHPNFLCGTDYKNLFICTLWNRVNTKSWNPLNN